MAPWLDRGPWRHRTNGGEGYYFRPLLRNPSPCDPRTTLGPKPDHSDPREDLPSCSPPIPSRKSRRSRCSPRSSRSCLRVRLLPRCPQRSLTTSAWSTAWCARSRSSATVSGSEAHSPRCATPTAPRHAPCRTSRSSTPSPARQTSPSRYRRSPGAPAWRSSTTWRSVPTACSTSAAPSITSAASYGATSPRSTRPTDRSNRSRPARRSVGACCPPPARSTSAHRTC